MNQHCNDVFMKNPQMGGWGGWWTQHQGSLQVSRLAYHLNIRFILYIYLRFLLLNACYRAFEKARSVKDKPFVILAKTFKGKGWIEWKATLLDISK